MKIGWTAALSVAAILGGSASAGLAQDISTFDSAGVLLGNDVQQATIALESRGFDVSQMMAKYDLAADMPYVQALNAEKNDETTRETVVVRFSEPPAQARTIVVWRSITFKAGKAPTLESYRAAVRERAGNETYWRDVGGTAIEQYVQWSKSGKKRGGLFKMLDSLPSSYPNPCVVGIGIGSSNEAVTAKVRAPQYGKNGGSGPPPISNVVTPQEFCGFGLIVTYHVPDRATGLVTSVDMLLIDQPQAADMAEKRDSFLEERRLAQIEAARKAGGKPVL
ncbi:hypothetical protein K7957_07710 [Sphingomonas yunnanensis]|uniref:hypothetical protein n=1 Tax=Sphingomonas yunnanensis TaxID=310400 RepID=UPI001CA6ED0C|nr:hypothetical protein [Sphingomonas yunnanensis]MBY9062814.1 hypothetical protein [Sphingomonas yunnanensis]